MRISSKRRGRQDDRREYMYEKAVLRSSKDFFLLRLHGAVNPNYGSGSTTDKQFCVLWMSFYHR
jgi:hypothetical protein